MIKKILKNKIFNFIISALEFVLFTGLILYLTFILMQRFSSKSNVNGYSLYAVATGSMVPIYKTDDVILVKNVEAKNLSVGDDIVYKGNRGGFEGKIVVHRIIKIEKNSDGSYRIFTKGVNNEDADPSIDETQVVGRVLRKIYTISIINKVVRNQYGFFFLIFCPFVLVIAVEIIETTIEKKYIEIEENTEQKDDQKAKEIVMMSEESSIINQYDKESDGVELLSEDEEENVEQEELIEELLEEDEEQK